MKKIFNFILILCLTFTACFALCGCLENPEDPPPVENITYNIVARADTEGQGTVYGTGTYANGEWITIVAVANPDYKFVKWKDGSTQNPRTLKVKDNYTYIAEFEKEELYALNSIAIYVTEINSIYSDIEVSKFAIKLNDKNIGGFNANVANPYDNQGFDIYSKTNNFVATRTNPAYIYTDLNADNVCSGETKIRIDFCLDTESSLNADYDVSRYQEFTIVPTLTKTTRTLETISITDASTTYTFNLNIVVDFVRVYP